jgi:serine/threonine protein phosphatase 1
MMAGLKSLFTSVSDHKSEAHYYLVVPDLHGVHSIYKKVEAYIKEVCEENRTIIFLGDYMDRGEAGSLDGKYFKDAGSYLIMRDLIQLQHWAIEKRRKIIFLRGNHEVFYEDYYLKNKKYAEDEYAFFRESNACLSYFFEKDKKFYDDFLLFLHGLKPYYHDKKYAYLFIHAGIDPDEKDIDKQVKDGLVYWIRDKFLFSEKKLPYTVIFGHTPFSKPFMRSDKIGLDSGVYKRGFLNLLQIDNKDSKIIQLQKN